MSEKVVQAVIGSVRFLVDGSSEEVSANKSGVRQTAPTIPQLPASARENLIEVVDELRTQFQSHWTEVVDKSIGPSEMAIEISFTFEAGINAWVIAGKGTAGVKALFKWTRSAK